MAAYIFPTAQQLDIVAAEQALLANATLHLFQGPIAFNEAITAADLQAIEANFSAYANIAIGSLPQAYVDPVNGGVSFTVPTKQWNRTLGTPDVGNNIYGGWIQTAGGDLYMAWQINDGWGMQNVGDSLPLELTLNSFGTNAVYVSIAGQDK